MPPLDASPPDTPAAGHPFAPFVRTICRGEKLSRSLSREEAAEAMGMILSGRVDPIQLGAFLMVLRYRKETPEELAGFADAARAAFANPCTLAVDLDWPSYADRHRQLPYFLLAARLLARNGVRVLMHGLDGVGPATTRKALAALGISLSHSFEEARAGLDRDNFAYLPLENFCPALETLFALRSLLGLRSAVNTFARILNPGAAPAEMQGVFHPTYLAPHQETARLLNQPRAAVFKGGAGEVQRNPEKPCRVAMVVDGECFEEVWPALTQPASHPWRDETLDPASLVALWHGEWTPAGPIAAITGTAAIALKLLGQASTMEEAQTAAEAMWRQRRIEESH
ncbi:MAG: glycosyl transferase family protein [Rhodospirillaceae bacterium]|jgi:anthranilate phosphoribosyltransferase|nr:glycosyl transferase family protein [Rhodospirillaceae bacterium]MBT6117725.1 glycosyl transferase family protein [Rhodospirillaceae bacterium]